MTGTVGTGGHMYISEYMTWDPITIPANMLLPEVRQILNEYQIRHLPVVDGEKKLIGIVTDRDLRSAYPSSVITRGEKILTFEQVEKTMVEDIMTRSCSTLQPECTLDDALVVFDRDNVGGIPIVSEDEVVLGFFSLLDLTAAYKKLFGVGEDGSVLVGIEDDGRDEILSELVTLLEQNNISLTRLIRLTDRDHATKIYLRMNCLKPAKIFKLLKSRGFVLLEP
jgi:acetoin utilization protein AcuB